MVFLFLFLMLFMAYRAFVYFQAGRSIAMTLSVIASLLFAGAIYVDYQSFDKNPEKSAALKERNDSDTGDSAALKKHKERISRQQGTDSEYESDFDDYGDNSEEEDPFAKMRDE